MRFLHVEFGHDAMTLDFALRPNNLAQRWVKKVRAAQRLKYSIDQPDRFYGFGTLAEDINVFQLLPDVVKARGIPDPMNPRPRDLRAMQMHPYAGIITDELLRGLGY